jgi:hypothetical protein
MTAYPESLAGDNTDQNKQHLCCCQYDSRFLKTVLEIAVNPLRGKYKV